MVETWQRVIGHTLRVGDKDVQITIHETCMDDNPGIPAHVRVVAPNGLITEGGVAEAWREMHVLLGIRPPSPPKAPESPEPQKSDPLPESSPQLPSIQQPAAASLPALAAARLSAPAHSAPATDEQESPQYEQEDEDFEAEEERPMNRNTLKETLFRVLNSPVEVADDSDGEYEDEPPREITAEDVAAIPNLATPAEAAAFIEDVDRNIELVEMRTHPSNAAMSEAAVNQFYAVIGVHSVRRHSDGFIRTARITGGSAAINAASKIVNAGAASIFVSVVFTW
jgi:hypothetical protein